MGNMKRIEYRNMEWMEEDYERDGGGMWKG
jgi:hypothetical protein